MEILEVDSDDFSFDLDCIVVELRREILLAILSISSRCLFRHAIVLLGPEPKVSLLSVPQESVEPWMSNDVAKDFKALADKLSSLAHVGIENIEMTDILIADVTWT